MTVADRMDDLLAADATVAERALAVPAVPPDDCAAVLVWRSVEDELSRSGAAPMAALTTRRSPMPAKPSSGTSNRAESGWWCAPQDLAGDPDGFWRRPWLAECDHPTADALGVILRPSL